MRKFFIPLLTLIFILLSCEKENSPTITDVKPGNITGILDIYDSDDNSGAYVSLKGTKISTTTDYNGKWTLTNVESGVYDIIFSKPGYDTTECYGFPFPGNGTAYCGCSTYAWATEYPIVDEWAIFKINANRVSNITFDSKYSYDTTWDDDRHGNSWISRIDTFLYMNGNLDYDGTFLLFFNFNSNVTKDNYIVDGNDYWYYNGYTFDSSKNTFKLAIRNGFLNYSLGGSGTKVYVIVYPGEYNYETDLRNGKRRWLGLGKPSNVVEFVVP
ncbi:MAG: carboxypeptidase-like regulatory domain-containing protein [bacterium]